MKPSHRFSLQPYQSQSLSACSICNKSKNNSIHVLAHFGLLFNWLFSNSKIFLIICVECSTRKNLTIHHLKKQNGRKTGKVKILCRKCHDEAEKKYDELGIINNGSLKITTNEKLQLDYMNGKIPFYSLGGLKTALN